MQNIKAMTDVIRHRGPDDEGFFVLGPQGAQCFTGRDTPSFLELSGLPVIEEKNEPKYSLSLGHRRLTILDLSAAGHQPMKSDDERFVVVFNGEIYNYLELKSELMSKGVVFKSTGDTEVLVESYRYWGEKCVDKFNGMFSFVIWDSKERVVFGARDRFGIKPLYYYIDHEGTIYGGSEIKQLVSFIKNGPVINKNRVYDYLIWAQTDHTDETLFKDIYQLPAGCRFKVRLDDPDIRGSIDRYYDLSKNIRSEKMTYKEAVSRYRELFFNSISLMLRSDVPVGTCLSGGLDSSSILSASLIQSPEKAAPFNTFSNCSVDKKYDEQEFIDCFKDNLNVRQYKSFPTMEELYSDLEKLIYHHDEPFLSTSIFAEWSVFKLVASEGKVKVTLDGHGADEQLIGYHTFIPSLLGTAFRRFQWIKLFKEMRSIHLQHDYSYLNIFLKLLFSIAPVRLIRRALKMTGRKDDSPKWMDLSSLDVDSQSTLRIGQNAKNDIENIMLSQVLSTSIPKQLKWSDRNSMARSVESRVPFLEHNLVEFTMGLPVSFRFDRGVTKKILRDAMKGILPEKIRCRVDKMGYVTPEEKWFKSEDRSKIIELVKESIISSQGLLKPELENEVDKMLMGKKPFSKLIWRSICLGQWMKIYSVKN